MQELKESLRSQKNTNVTGYTMNGEPRAILWTKGINAPNMQENGGDFTKFDGNYLEYLLNYQPNSKWYDVNKKQTGNLSK